MNLLVGQEGALDPVFQVDSRERQRIEAAARQRSAVPAGGGVAVVELQLDLAVSALPGEFIEQRVGQRHVQEVGARIDLVLLVQSRELLQVDHGLVRGHPHGHADHQRRSQERGQRFSRPRGHVVENALQLRGIGGVQRVAPRIRFSSPTALYMDLSSTRAAHARPDQISQFRLMRLLQPCANFVNFRGHLPGHSG